MKAARRNVSETTVGRERQDAETVAVGDHGIKRVGYAAVRRKHDYRTDRGAGAARILQHPVSVESESGVGSRFSIVVPRASAKVLAEEPAAATPPMRSAGVGRILYVESDPGVRQSITMLLGIEGYKVAAVSNGEEALNIIASRGIDPQIIISDFHLPAGETGEQVVRRVREVLGRRIPALLLTGETRETRAPNSSMPSDRILCKPVDANLLLSEISSLISHQQQPRQR
jgi:CheY-like chemotaxis protein